MIPRPSLALLRKYGYLDPEQEAFERLLEEIGYDTIWGRFNWVERSNGWVEAATPAAMWMELRQEEFS